MWKSFREGQKRNVDPAPLARVRELRSDLIDPAIAAHHGRIVKRHHEVEFKIERDLWTSLNPSQRGNATVASGTDLHGPEERRPHLPAPATGRPGLALLVSRAAADVEWL